MSVTLTRLLVPDSLRSISETAGIFSQRVRCLCLLRVTIRGAEVQTLPSLYTSHISMEGSRGDPRPVERGSPFSG